MTQERATPEPGSRDSYVDWSLSQTRQGAAVAFFYQFGGCLRASGGVMPKPLRIPQVFGFAPARVELLGNHTDHNRGLVLSVAIDRYTCVAAAPNQDERVRVWSENFAGGDEFAPASIVPLPRGSWANYVRGVVAALADSGVVVHGFDAALIGDVPVGGGLSSSASLECAVAMAVLGLFGAGPGLQPDGMHLAELIKQAEHRYAGVACGVLDQFSSLFGKAGHALYLDCDTLQHEAVPLGSDPPAIVVCDSNAPRELAKGKYNERRAECEAASEALHRLNPTLPRGEVPSLRDVPMHVFLDQQSLLEPVPARRARHVLTENQRVMTGRELLRRSGDVRGFGELMLESHRSSRDDFENSSPELDLLIELASRQPGFIGGKLSGAGWGGCTVNLVDQQHADSFAQSISEQYSQRTGRSASVMICHAADGANVVRL
jgi:galactokinase